MSEPTVAQIRQAYEKVLQQIFEVNVRRRVVDAAAMKELLRKEQSGVDKLGHEVAHEVWQSTVKAWLAVKKCCPCCGKRPHLPERVREFQNDHPYLAKLIAQDGPTPF